MAQKIKALEAEPEKLCLVHWTDSHKLFSNLYTHALAHLCSYTYYAGTHIH